MSGTNIEKQYLQALGAATLNSIVSILAVLSKRKLINEAELANVRTALSKPFSTPENSDNPLCIDAQRNIEQLLGEVTRYLRKG